MPILELTDDQIVELIKQLPPERRKKTLMALAVDTQSKRANRMQFAEEQLRKCSKQRGKNWDAMSEDEREALIDQLIHEDRPCDQP